MSRRGKLPEAEAIRRAERTAVTMLRRPPSCDRGHLSLPMQTRRAHNAIARAATLSGTSPVEVIARLGLTPDEIARMGPFTRTVIWS